MASSSVSQESLDMDDEDNTARRNRIRVHRGHSGRGSMPHRGLPDKLPFGDGGDQDKDAKDHQNGDVGEGGLGITSHGHLLGDHESPTRGAAARLKDKRNRPIHVKGKLPKDKRKLREKRRSTGVVHCIPSTESTGDSLDDDDDDEDAVHDTKKNTTYNEGPAPGHHHQGTHEGRHSSNPAYSHPRRNKSPSDLEADLEDNQDYDSTVSHSETNLTLIGRSDSSEISQNLPSKQQAGGMDNRIGGGSSKYSSAPSSAFKLNTGNISSDADSSRTNTSTSSSVFSRYREADPALSSAGTTNTNSGAVPESDSARRFNPTTGENKQGQPQVQPRPVGFSVFNNSIVSGQRSDKSSYSSYVSSASKFRDRDGGGSAGAAGSVNTRLTGYQAPRPFVSSAASSVSVQQQSETIAQLEKQLDKERQESSKLQQAVLEKDKRIAELQKEIELLNKECDDLDADNIQLQEENKALIRAMSKLTSSV